MPPILSAPLSDEIGLRQAIEDRLEHDFGWPLAQSREVRRQIADIAAHEALTGPGDWHIQDDDHDECVPQEDFERNAELIHDLVGWLATNITMEQWAMPADDGDSKLRELLGELNDHITGVAHERPEWPTIPSQDEIDEAKAKREGEEATDKAVEAVVEPPPIRPQSRPRPRPTVKPTPPPVAPDDADDEDEFVVPF